MWNGDWGRQPETAGNTGHKLILSSGEANEIDWAVVPVIWKTATTETATSGP